MQADDSQTLLEAQRVGLRKETRKRNYSGKRKGDRVKRLVLLENSTHLRKDSVSLALPKVGHRRRAVPILNLQSMIHLLKLMY